MTLYHWTTPIAARNIARWGLMTSYSQTGRREIYLHTKSLSDKLREHTAKRHGHAPIAMVKLRVTVQRSVVKCRYVGIWVSLQNIPPSRVTLCLTSCR